MKRIALLSCMVLVLFGCATKRVPSDYDVVLKRPRPPTNEARIQECIWLDTTIAREKGLASYATANAISPWTAMAHQDAAVRNMAVLESRSRALNCRPVFQSAPAAASGQPGFDQCFTRCRQYTGRSNEQCFDSCNK